MSRSFMDSGLENVTATSEIQEYKKNPIITEEEYKETKKMLNEYKRQASLQVENRKIKMIDLFTESISKNLYLMLNADIEVKSAMDLKFLAEANEKSMKMLDNLLRNDSADERGTAMQTQIMIKTFDRNGNETNAFVGINNG